MAELIGPDTQAVKQLQKDVASLREDVKNLANATNALVVEIARRGPPGILAKEIRVTQEITDRRDESG